MTTNALNARLASVCGALASLFIDCASALRAARAKLLGEPAPRPADVDAPSSYLWPVADGTNILTLAWAAGCRAFVVSTGAGASVPTLTSPWTVDVYCKAELIARGVMQDPVAGSLRWTQLPDLESHSGEVWRGWGERCTDSVRAWVLAQLDEPPTRTDVVAQALFEAEVYASAEDAQVELLSLGSDESTESLVLAWRSLTTSTASKGGESC